MSTEHAKPLYLVALVPPEPLRARIRAIQEDFAARAGGVKALQIPPYVTLSAPFICERESEFPDLLATVIKGRAPFTVALTHLERFGHHPTAYYAIERSDALQALHEDVLSVVKDVRQRDFTSYYRKAKGRAGLLLRVYGSEYVLERFLPHLSLTRHDADKEKFAALWSEEPHVPPESFVAEDVVVLRQEPDGTWVEHLRVSF